MHTTRIVLKNGRKISGIIKRIRVLENLDESYVDLWTNMEDPFPDEDYEPKVERFFYKDMKSCKTLHDRISINKIGDKDDLAFMKKYHEKFKEGEMGSQRHPCEKLV